MSALTSDVMRRRLEGLDGWLHVFSGEQYIIMVVHSSHVI